jgi:hypothetical protein
VTPAFLSLVACAIGAAYGAAVAVRRRGPRLAAAATVLLYAAAGVNGAMLVTLAGDGRILPGRQLHPEVMGGLGASLADAPLGFPAPYLAVVALLAHALVWAVRPDRAGFLAPLPSTLLFGALAAVRPEDRFEFHRAVGPEETAYLTLQTRADGSCRLLVASGPDDAVFLRVRHVHDAESAPPAPKLRWSADGAVLVVAALGEDLLALPREGEPVGYLPRAANAWPREDRSTEPADALRARSEARLQVAKLLQEHGGAR